MANGESSLKGGEGARSGLSIAGEPLEPQGIAHLAKRVALELSQTESPVLSGIKLQVSQLLCVHQAVSRLHSRHGILHEWLLIYAAIACLGCLANACCVFLHSCQVMMDATFKEQRERVENEQGEWLERVDMLCRGMEAFWARAACLVVVTFLYVYL